MSVPESRSPILVLGIGNILLRDEGVGVRVIETMRALDLPPGVEVADGGTAGADLLDVICDRRKVIVVDAMDADAEPGTILRLDIESLDGPDRPGVSLHEIGLVETLAMARSIGSGPDEICVFGIQPREIRPGDTLTEEMVAIIPEVIELILAETRR